MKLKNKTKSILSAFLAVCMLLSISPVTTFAAQSNEYVDPAENWLSSNGRTNELDVNATTTYETQYCCVCNMQTTVLTYRVPEYTRSGETALNRDVKYSDGTKIDGENSGNTDSGTPGIDAYYTGYHYTKSVCQLCGTINSVNGYGAYDFNNNVYSLHACDNNFFVDFDATTHEHYNEEYHLTTLKQGEYCQFCKGTFAVGVKGLSEHKFSEQVDGQIGNNRFYVTETCTDCNYQTGTYKTAKSVVSSYYGIEDGEAHTLTVSDLSDMKILSVCITVVIFGRMIEIYLYSSVGAIPFATMANREWGQVGSNYLRGLVALAFQGFFIMVCVGIYAALVNSFTATSDIHSTIFSIAAYTVVLCFTLFKTGSISKSIFNAH